MRKRSFFGLSKPSFQYELATKIAATPITIPKPKTVTLYIKKELKHTSKNLKTGMQVKTGQRLMLDEGDTTCTLSSATGTIETIEPFLADYGQTWTAVTIKADNDDTADEAFSEFTETPSLEILDSFFSSCPGEPDIKPLLDAQNPVQTIVIYGGNADILIDTSLHVLKSETEAVNEGIEVLRKITGIEDIVIVVPEESVQNYSGHLDARIQPVSSQYPYAQPLMVMYNLTGRLPDENGSAALGTYFIRSEAVAAIGKAFSTGTIPFHKMVTVIDKKGDKHLAKARIGTPVNDLLKTFGIEVKDKDKIVFGGPMTGRAIYSEDLPIGPDTDAIIVQDKERDSALQ
jgi:electron transport complex protein RnfC